jgi:hypothetical protein
LSAGEFEAAAAGVAADGIGSDVGSCGIAEVDWIGAPTAAEFGVGGVTLRMNGTGMFGMADGGGAVDEFCTLFGGGTAP